MTKRIRILLMAAFAIAVLTGTASAYDGENSDSGLMKKTIIIADDDNREIKYDTLATTVSEALEEKGISVSDEDYISKSLDSTLSNGDKIIIKRPFDVTIKINSEETKISTLSSTVNDVLTEYSSLIGDNYQLISPSNPSSHLSKNMVIEIEVQTERIETVTEEIPFETEYVDNAELDKGMEQVSQEGQKGIIEIEKKYTYFGDKLKSVEEVSRKEVQPVKNKIIQVGTKEDVPEEQPVELQTIDGYTYKHAINMVSTAYTPYDPGCSGTTATGIAAGYGVAAVDTSVIPFGTKLYIPGYGVAVAADTGGAIDGNRIDLCYNSTSEAFSWGRRNITVYVIE